MHADYGFRILMYLCLRGEQLSQISAISESYGISAHHVTKVAQCLSKHGYIKAVRGRKGGLRLALAPEDINLGEVFRELEPSLRILECFDIETNTCPIIKACALHEIFGRALEAFIRVLDQTNLAQITHQPERLSKYLKLKKSESQEWRAEGND